MRRSVKAAAAPSGEGVDEGGFGRGRGAPAWLAGLSSGCASRLRLEGDRLHLSAELKGSPELDLALARAGREGASPRLVWHGPFDFDAGFGASPAACPKESSSLASGASWVEDYLKKLLLRAMAAKASDIHVTCMGPYAQISFRVMGLMREVESLDGTMGLRLVRGLFQGRLSQAESGFSEYERYDGRVADRSFLPEGLFAVRLHSEPIQSPLSQGPSLSLSLRLLYDGSGAQGGMAERLSSLGFSQAQIADFEDWGRGSGLVCVSGPTGHGKTTVLKNVFEAMARERPTRSYFSLEDPPEYAIQGVRQLKVVTKAGSERERRRALMDALAGLMRSDPDVLLLGEIRYLEAAQAALNAALTGHAVWTTVHAGSALGVVARLAELGLPPASLCAEGALQGLSHQRLLPLLCPSCARPLAAELSSLNPGLERRLRRLYPGGALEALRLRGEGCGACSGLGLKGMRVAAELVPTRDGRLLELLSRGDLRGACSARAAQGPSRRSSPP